MNTEAELAAWRDTWRGVPSSTRSVFAFRARYRRQEFWLRLRYIFGLCFAVALAVYSALVLYYDFRVEVLTWAIVVWLTTTVATVFSIWNWRILWTASARPVQEYSTIYAQRNLAKLRAVRFGYWFLTLQVLISAPWLTWDFLHSGLTPIRYAGAMATLAVLTTVFTAGLTWSRRRAVAELKDVEAFRRVLDVT